MKKLSLYLRPKGGVGQACQKLRGEGQSQARLVAQGSVRWGAGGGTSVQRGFFIKEKQYDLGNQYTGFFMIQW